MKIKIIRIPSSSLHSGKITSPLKDPKDGTLMNRRMAELQYSLFSVNYLWPDSYKKERRSQTVIFPNGKSNNITHNNGK